MSEIFKSFETYTNIETTITKTIDRLNKKEIKTYKDTFKMAFCYDFDFSLDKVCPTEVVKIIELTFKKDLDFGFWYFYSKEIN